MKLLKNSFSYRIPGGFKGKTDLLNEYAFHGNSQGDETRSNDISDYIASKGWLSFHFDGVEGIDENNQEAIYAEALRRKRLNEIYIQECKDNGTYGEPLGDITLELLPNSLFDDAQPSPMNSYSFSMLDLTK